MIRRLIILFTFLAASRLSAKPALLYDSSLAIHERVKDGFLSQNNDVALIDIRDQAKLSALKESDHEFFITVGEAATQYISEKVTSKPVIFALVSAPKYAGYGRRSNMTGVSLDIPSREFYEVLKDILPAKSRIGFIYSADKNDYLTTEAEFTEGRFGFASSRAKIAERRLMGPELKKMVEEEKIAAFWIFPDPLYNEEVFNRLSKLCLAKKVLLVTSFESLVTQSGAAFAIAPSYYGIGLQAAEMADQILKGRKPDQIAIESPEKTDVYINQKTVGDLGITLPDSLLNREKVTSLFDKALKQLKEGKEDSAVGTLESILELDSKHSGAKNLLKQITARNALAKGRKLLAAGDTTGAINQLVKASSLPEAREELSRLKSKMKSQIGQMISDGIKLFKKKQYASCSEKMSLVLTLDPGNKKAKTYYEKSQKRLKAVKALR